MGSPKKGRLGLGKPSIPDHASEGVRCLLNGTESFELLGFFRSWDLQSLRLHVPI